MNRPIAEIVAEMRARAAEAPADLLERIELRWCGGTRQEGRDFYAHIAASCPSNVIALADGFDERGREIERLTRERDEARAEWQRAWKLYEEFRHLSWTINCADGIAHNLEMHADEIDCGSDCEVGYTESDTNAHVCPNSDKGECPSDVACELRDLAKALRTAPVATAAAEARVRELADALAYTLPMARGYAHEHPVGANKRKVNEADEVLSAYRAREAERDGGSDA